MPLTTAQKATLKAAIQADAPLLALYTASPNGAQDVADELNKIATPAFKVWRTEAHVTDILDAVNWSLYTPVDAVDVTVLFSNRLLMIQTKQMNLQNMLVGRDTINMSKSNIRAGLRDAVIQIPAGAGGSNVNPGGGSGATVLNVCVRDANRIEKILTTGTAQTGTVSADVMSFEGRITYQDVDAAMV